MNTPELYTKRLFLRQVSLDDVQEIFDCWMKDENVSRYMYWKSSDDINEAKKFVNYELSKINCDDWYRWIIELKDIEDINFIKGGKGAGTGTGKIIGTCLIYFNEEEGTWDISYNLGQAYWGMGYTTEAMKKVLNFAKNELKLKEVIAVHAVENPASGRVIEKLGFKYEKEVPYECNGGEIRTTGKYYRLYL